MNFVVFFFFIAIFNTLFLDINASRLQRYGLKSSNNTVDIGDELNNSDALNDTKLSDKQVNNQLFGDKTINESKVGKQIGRNVTFIGNGNISLSLNDLTFALCSDCRGRFEICYESWSTPTSALHGSCSPSQCELNIYGKPDVVKVGDVNGGILTDRGLICDTLKIENGRSKINVINDIPTCVPKIENGIINLQVRESDPGCHVEVVNAKIKYPEIATTPPPTADKSDDPTSTSSFEWWKILLIVFVGIVVFGIFAFFGYLCYKKQRSTKSTVSPTEEPTPVISVAQESTVTIQPPSSKTKRPDLNFTKFEPSKSRKTQKKTVKKEPTTTEEYVPPPAPKVTVASPPDPTKPVPRLPQYSIPQRLIPRSYKSLKTDSLEETIKKNKLTPVESVISSVARNVLKSKDSGIVQKMKMHYPEVKRRILDDEILLLCVQISVMFSKLNEIATEAERNLTVLGVQFDAEHRIVNMSPEARQYLQACKTPILNVYFAFGAEYSEYITDDMDVLPKLSVAHQLVIALQPRFPEFNRRKALTWLRRELPQIRGNYNPAERKIMPFPVNAIEKAYLRDSKYFVCLSEINTDSEGDRKRMAEAKEKQLLKKNEAQIDGGVSKRKKKSTKKRH